MSLKSDLQPQVSVMQARDWGTHSAWLDLCFL